MQKSITVIALLTFYFANIYAQKDTSRFYYDNLFLQGLKEYKLDSTDIAELFNSAPKQSFFNKILVKSYTDDSLSNKQSFFVVIFTFPEFSSLIPKYAKIKKKVYNESTEYFKEKLNYFTIKKEAFENDLIMIEEQERQKRIEELELRSEEDIIETGPIKYDADTTLLMPVNTENIEKNKLKKLEEKIELEEKKLNEEDKKMLEEKKRMEEERRKIELEEKKKIDDR